MAEQRKVVSLTEYREKRNKIKNAIKLCVNLAPNIAEALREIAEKRKISYTDAIRRAITTEYYMEKALSRGAVILIQERDGKVKLVDFDNREQA